MSDPTRTARLAVAPAIVFLLLAAADSAAQLPYPSFPSMNSPGGPRVVFSGEFTGDGFADLVVSGTDDGRIRVFAGTASGSYLGGANIFVGGEPVALHSADFDRDGDLDLAWVDEASGDVGVLLFSAGNPPGFVELRQPGPDEPTGIALVDTDADGWVELVAAHGGADVLVTYPNVGGDLGAGVPAPAGDGPDRIALLNHPGGPTLALRQSGRLSRNLTLTNIGDGRTATVPFPGAGEIFAVDLEEDGADELLVVDETAGEIEVWRFDGAAWFPDFAFECDPTVTGVDAAEVAPGMRRLAVASQGRRRVGLYSIGAGSILRHSNWYCGGRSQQLLYEDADGDGAPDVVVAQSDLNRLLFMNPLGSGLFARQVWDAPGGAVALSSTTDVGGQLRLAVAAQSPAQIGVYTPAGVELGEASLFSAPEGIRAVRFADLDGGVAGLDIAGVSRTGGLGVYLSDGAGGYTAQPTFVPHGEVADLEFVDVVGGPALDLVLARLVPAALVIYEGLGNGQFNPTPAAEVTTTEPLVVVRSRDLDLDGRDDIVALGFESLLTFFLNKEGQSLVGTDLLVENSPRDLAFGRFNVDPYPDIAVVSQGTSEFAVVTSLLAGFYTVSARGVQSLPGAARIEVGDFDANGADDLCILASASRAVGIHLNIGSAEEPVFRFTPPLQAEMVESGVDLALADLDGDGEPDLIGIDGQASVIAVRLTDPFGAAGIPVASIEVEASTSPRRVIVHSTAEFAHDLRLLRSPGPVVLPLTQVGPGLYEALDSPPDGVEAVYVVEDRSGRELDRLGVSSNLATGAPGHFEPGLLPARYESGRAILRMRAPAGVVPEVKVFDLRGRRVTALPVEEEGDGWFEAAWTGLDYRGRPVSRGRYLVRASLGTVSGTASIHLR